MFHIPFIKIANGNTAVGKPYPKIKMKNKEMVHFITVLIYGKEQKNNKQTNNKIKIKGETKQK